MNSINVGTKAHQNEESISWPLFPNLSFGYLPSICLYLVSVLRDNMDLRQAFCISMERKVCTQTNLDFEIWPT